MPNSLKSLTLFLIIPLLYSCQKPLHAQENHLEKTVAHAHVAQAKHRTKHIRKQQRNIHDRLRGIRERMEKKKKRGRKGGK
jgi:hypothetical protein